MNLKVEDPNWEDRDRFILSKGHAGIAYAPVLCDLGFNDKEMLKTFNLSGSKMGIHLDANIHENFSPIFIISRFWKNRRTVTAVRRSWCQLYYQ